MLFILYCKLLLKSDLPFFNQYRVTMINISSINRIIQFNFLYCCSSCLVMGYKHCTKNISIKLLENTTYFDSERVNLFGIGNIVGIA